MGLILAIVIIVFALWETAASKWILVVAGVLLLLHAIGCKCKSCDVETPKGKEPVPKKKK